MSRGSVACDRAVAALIAADPDLIIIDRHDIAVAANCTPAHASAILQQHRIAQESGMTDFVVNCEGRARGSVWIIHSGPGCARMDLRRRMTMGHGEYIAVDAAQRLISDIRRELKPSVLAHPAVTAFLDHLGTVMESNVRGLVSQAHAAVDLLETMTGETADRSRVPAI